MHHKSIFERYLESAERTADMTLRFFYQRQMIIEELFQDKLLDEIAEKAANKVFLRLDASTALNDVQQLIDELNNLLN